MGRLLSCYHKFLFIVLILIVMGCHQDKILFKRDYSASESEEMAKSLLGGAAFYFQGSVPEQMLLHESVKHNPNHAPTIRELGVAFLKRGLGSEAFPYYVKASDMDPKSWAGYMAYCWLYFYRDYETALERIEQLDTLTPGFVDYPQATSIDYMRGICYLQLDDYEQAIYYFEKHLQKETEDVGADYIDALPYQLLGISYHKNQEFEKADGIFNLGLQYNKGSADLYYYKTQNLLSMGKKKSAHDSFRDAEKWFAIGGTNTRNYVEEFYAIYQEDLDELSGQF